MLSQSDKESVLHLFNQGNDFYQIKSETHFKMTVIKSILKQSQGELFIYSLNTLNLKEFYYLEKSFITFFIELYERIPISINFYRNYYHFFPPCLYLFFKLKGINVSFSDLIYLKPKRSIRSGMKVLLKFYPEYYRRDRYQLTLLKITRIIETFQLDPTFTNVSDRLLGLLWDKLCHANEGTIAASIYLLTSILLWKKYPTLREICSYLRITPSTPYLHLKKLKINDNNFSTFNGLKASSSQIRKLFRKDKILNQHMKLSKYYYVCCSCYSLNEGVEFNRQKMILKCDNCGASFPKYVKSKIGPKFTNFWVKNCFDSILKTIKALSIMLNKTKQTITDNDLQLVYGLRKYTQTYFGLYKNMRTLITKTFHWKQDVKRRINTITTQTTFQYHRGYCLPNFESNNRDFIYSRSDYFFIQIRNSALRYDYIKYRYLNSTGKAIIIFQFQKLFKLQEIHKICPDCHKPYLKEYNACLICNSTIFTPIITEVNKNREVPTQDQSEEVQYLKKIIKDLTSDQNKRLLEKSDLEIVGFSMQEFYENYIYVPKGIKPAIEWSNNKLLNKIKFQQTLSKLEKQNNLVKLFYNSQQWKIRKTEILERDKDKCSICSRPSSGVYHRLSAIYNPEIWLDHMNLITICRKSDKQINED